MPPLRSSTNVTVWGLPVDVSGSSLSTLSTFERPGITFEDSGGNSIPRINAKGREVKNVLRLIGACIPAEAARRRGQPGISSSVPLRASPPSCFTISVRDSGLVIHMPGRPDVVLRPIYPDGFAGAVVSVVKFSRDARGVVTGFTVNSSGVRGLRFDRVKP